MERVSSAWAARLTQTTSKDTYWLIAEQKQPLDRSISAEEMLGTLHGLASNA